MYYFNYKFNCFSLIFLKISQIQYFFCFLIIKFSSLPLIPEEGKAFLVFYNIFVLNFRET